MGMKVSFAMVRPKVTHTILMNQTVKYMQIRPFATKEAAPDRIRA